MMEIKVEGLEEVKKALAELPLKIEKKVIRKAAYSGSALLKQGIKQVAPIRTTGGPKRTKDGFRSPGFLQKNIKMRFKKRQGPFQAIYMVGPMGQAFYGRFVELGHAAGKRKKYGRGITEATGMRMVPPHPFIMPKFDSLTQQIIDKMKNKLIEGTMKEGAALGFKTA